jgi:hypothetical protein
MSTPSCRSRSELASSQTRVSGELSPDLPASRSPASPSGALMRRPSASPASAAAAPPVDAGRSRDGRTRAVSSAPRDCCIRLRIRPSPAAEAALPSWNDCEHVADFGRGSGQTHGSHPARVYPGPDGRSRIGGRAWSSRRLKPIGSCVATAALARLCSASSPALGGRAGVDSTRVPRVSARGS